MAWPRLMPSLRTFLGRNSRTAELPSVERVRDTVNANDLLGGDQEAIAAIIADGRLERYEEGHKLIIQNNNDDDVFFIMTGSVNILIGKHLCDTREAPQVVGEMAAGSPGKPRTANVVIARGGATLLRVRACVLRNLLQRSTAIRERYSKRYEEVARQNAAFFGQVKRSSSLSPWVVPLVAGLGASIFAGAYGLSRGWASLDIIAVAFAMGTITCIFVMMLDASRMVLSLFLSAGFAIVAFGISYAMPEGTIVVSPEWLYGVEIDLAFGRTLTLSQQIAWLVGAVAVFVFAGWMYFRMTEISS